MVKAILASRSADPEIKPQTPASLVDTPEQQG
jgi:hypothetical protein